MGISYHRSLQSLRLMGALIDCRLRGRPLLLSHLVTCRCPCRCETCLWRGLVAEEMSVAEIEKAYRDAAGVGIVINSIWGGEPLVREDLPRILQASRHAGLITTLITSGFRFNERLDELVPWLDTVIFSLDDPSPRHDEMRGMPGLFEGVCQAIDRLSRLARGPRILINSVISRLNQEVVIDLARWAKARRVPIYFNPIEVGLLGRPDSALSKRSLAVDDETLAGLFRELISLKARGYPICNSYTYLRTFIPAKRSYQCHARKVCIELRPNGDLVDCLDRFHPVANVREISLRELLARPDIHHRRFRSVRCQVCNNANVVDTSHIWELRPESIYALVRSHVVDGARQGARLPDPTQGPGSAGRTQM